MPNVSYLHRQYPVEAIRLTKENLSDVVEWLGDDLYEIHNQVQYEVGGREITVPARNLQFGTLSLICTYRDPVDSSNVLYQLIFCGDWIVRDINKTYVQYTNEEFNRRYVQNVEFGDTESDDDDIIESYDVSDDNDDGMSFSDMN